MGVAMRADHVSSVQPGVLDADASDQSLLRRFRNGDQDAATQIFLRYAHRLSAVARANCARDLGWRLDADDIVQSVFHSFFDGASRGGYDVASGEDLWRLLLVIALNKIRAQGAFHRAAKRDVRRTVGADALDEVRPPAYRDDGEAYTMLVLVVREALAHLPEVSRRIVELRIDGYEVAEIAQQTGRAKRTVERNLQEFRKHLANLLEMG
jgi:RNA polymerase sigma-70 factor (ECF subfamily)